MGKNKSHLSKRIVAGLIDYFFVFAYIIIMMQFFGIPNFKDVEVLGQYTSSYPSKYVNVRETNAKMREGNFTGQSTYMVAADGLGLTGRWTTDQARPMSVSVNGKMKPIGSKYQKGKKKK